MANARTPRNRPLPAAPPPPQHDENDITEETDYDDPTLDTAAIADPAQQQSAVPPPAPAPRPMVRTPAAPAPAPAPAPRPMARQAQAITKAAHGEPTRSDLMRAGPIGEGWTREPVDFLSPVGWLETYEGSAIQGVVFGVERFEKPKKFRAILLVLTQNVELIIAGGERVPGHVGDLAGITVTAGLENLANKIEAAQESGSHPRELWLMCLEKIDIGDNKTFWKFKGSSRPASPRHMALLEPYQVTSHTSESGEVPFLGLIPWAAP